MSEQSDHVKVMKEMYLGMTAHSPAGERALEKFEEMIHEEEAKRETPNERVSPFSNGSEYCSWIAANCDRCKKAASIEAQYEGFEEMPCQIEAALYEASLSDGTISVEIAERMGWIRTTIFSP